MLVPLPLGLLCRVVRLLMFLILLAADVQIIALDQANSFLGCRSLRLTGCKLIELRTLDLMDSHEVVAALICRWLAIVIPLDKVVLLLLQLLVVTHIVGIGLCIDDVVDDLLV